MSGRKRKAVSYAEEGSSTSSSEEFSGSNDSAEESDEDVSVVSEESKSKKSPKKGNNKENNAPKALQNLQRSNQGSTSIKSTAPRSNAQATVPTSVKVMSSVPISSTSETFEGPAVTTDAAAKKLIYHYLRSTNRPFSAIQIHDNLHKRIQKSTLERLLVVMSGTGGELLCKEYGKSKIYFPNQTMLSENNAGTDLDQLQEDNSLMQQEIDTLKDKTKKMQEIFNQMAGEPADCEIDKVLEEAKNLWQEKNNQIGNFQKRIKANPDPNALEKAIKRHNEMRKEWIRRKEICKDAVDGWADAVNKKSKAVMEELGLELDEDSHQVIPVAIKFNENSLGSSSSNHKR